MCFSNDKKYIPTHTVLHLQYLTLEFLYLTFIQKNEKYQITDECIRCNEKVLFLFLLLGF